MKFLCLDVPKPDATMEKYQPYLREEVRYAWNLYKSGVVREINFRQDRPGVAIIAEAPTIESARAALAEFPLAKAGLIAWDVIPLGPFVNWEMLFGAGTA